MREQNELTNAVFSVFGHFSRHYIHAAVLQNLVNNIGPTHYVLETKNEHRLGFSHKFIAERSYVSRY